MNPPLPHKLWQGGIKLQSEYLVASGNENIGNVQVQRQGLYYQIRCRCCLTGCIRYKLLASCGENSADLGICVPKDGVFGVDTKIPIKRLGEGTLSFRLVPRHSKVEGSFVPISPDEPFSYIRQLQNAHLEKQDGCIGVVIPQDQNSSDRPTGQWSEPITSE